MNRAAQGSSDLSRTRRRRVFGIPQPGRVASNELSSSPLQASFPRSSMCIHSGRTWSICGRTSRGWTQRYRPTLTQFALTRCVLLLPTASSETAPEVTNSGRTVRRTATVQHAPPPRSQREHASCPFCLFVVLTFTPELNINTSLRPRCQRGTWSGSCSAFPVCSGRS